jgi:hypothetical protein
MTINENQIPIEIVEGKFPKTKKSKKIPNPADIEEGEVVPKKGGGRPKKGAVVIVQQDPIDTPKEVAVQEQIEDAIATPIDASFPAFLATRQIASPVRFDDDDDDEEEAVARRLQEIRERKAKKQRLTEKEASYERDRSIRREQFVLEVQRLQKEKEKVLAELDRFDELTKEEFLEREDTYIKTQQPAKKATKKATKKVVQEGDKKQRGATLARRSLKEVLRNGDKLILTMDKAITAEWVDGKLISRQQEFNTLNQMLRFHTMTLLGKNSCGSGWTSYRLQRAGTDELVMLDPLFVISQSRDGSEEEEDA